jgi:pimeloyl-[acyl-carrier protein] methyl ester esterase
LREEFANLRCPVLYILGKLDTLVPARVAKYLAKLQANIRTVVFPKASHAVFISHSQEFLTEVRCFLNE